VVSLNLFRAARGRVTRRVPATHEAPALLREVFESQLNIAGALLFPILPVNIGSAVRGASSPYPAWLRLRCPECDLPSVPGMAQPPGDGCVRTGALLRHLYGLPSQ
jgi:hypothetical protein